MTDTQIAITAKPLLMSFVFFSAIRYSIRALILLTLLVALWLSCGLLLSSNVSAQQYANQVNSVRLWHSPDKTRVVFDVAEDITHNTFNLKNPERLVVDIQNGGFKVALPSLDADNPHLSGVRSGSPRKGVLRFVFELKKPLEAHSFVLTPNELYGYRLVLDLIDSEAIPVIAVVGAGADALDGDQAGTNFISEPPLDLAEGEVAAVVVTKPPAIEASSSAEQSLIIAAPALTKQKIIIAIDAGHGGEDPGATGHRGSREKQITLSIAKHLQKVINADSRMQSFLVREGDYYIDLTRRRIMARQKGADIFVSIHADAFTKKSANGLSVFALSQRGATSAMARALAKKENAADLIGGVSLADKDAVLAKVLVDLSMTNTISESVNLGGRVLKELSKVGRLHSKRVEQASFVVLKSPDIPSILIETGFITNLDEEKKLRTTRYQKKIANGIHRALGEYYDQTPYYNQASYASPRMASSSSSQALKAPRHRVKRGDSLSSIALKYGTTIAELKRLNKLSNNTAVLGRRLRLPSGNASSNNRLSRHGNTAVHVVVRGDSLSKISAHYNVTINALKRVNRLTKDTVYKGQKIKIPGGVRAKKLVTKHTVKRGDTLSEIAEQYGVTIKQMMLANGLPSGIVRLGQTLKIPR
ncbi:MAG: N-acetylmuramoyl-L-alanine amidase [Arenicella sp.]|nr:N-acetylmuramoyl-L-alanine amidase [Arenicella sp.]